LFFDFVAIFSYHLEKKTVFLFQKAIIKKLNKNENKHTKINKLAELEKVNVLNSKPIWRERRSCNQRALYEPVSATNRKK
jgi:hypothetical protein